MYNGKMPLLSVYMLEFHIRFLLEKVMVLTIFENHLTMSSLYVEILHPLPVFEDLKIKLLAEMIQMLFSQTEGNHNDYIH